METYESTLIESTKLDEELGSKSFSSTQFLHIKKKLHSKEPSHITIITLSKRTHPDWGKWDQLPATLGTCRAPGILLWRVKLALTMKLNQMLPHWMMLYEPRVLDDRYLSGRSKTGPIYSVLHIWLALFYPFPQIATESLCAQLCARHWRFIFSGEWDNALVLLELISRWVTWYSTSRKRRRCLEPYRWSI